MTKAIIIVILLTTSALKVWASLQKDSLELILSTYVEKDTSRVNTLNKISYHYWTSNPVLSEKYSIRALQLADSIGYLPGKAFANRSLGVANWAQGNYEEGLKYLFQARDCYDSLNDELNLANVFLNIGLIYSAQSNHSQAQPYFERAINTFSEFNKPERQVNAANHLGDLFRRENNFEKAHYYYSNALSISDSIAYDYGKATSLMSLGKLFTEENQLVNALKYCQEALALQGKIEDHYGETNTLYTLGVIYKLKNEPARADEMLIKALNKAEQINAKKQKKDIYLELKELAKNQGNYKQALNYFEQYVSINDSLLNAQMLRNIVNLENKVVAEQKEKEFQKKALELTILQKEARINSILKYILFGSIFTLLGFSILIYSRQRIKIKKNKELLHSQRQLAQAEKENASLKEKELKSEIIFKNKELTSYALNFKQKNELFTEIKDQVKFIRKAKNSNLNTQLNTLIRLIDNNISIDNDWQDFKRYFEEVHSNFFSSLKSQFPEITNNDLKLCALIKLNLNLKEAANILGVSPDSVKTARYRLRKKLKLKRNENLSSFLLRFEEPLKG